ncbi:MAG: glucose-1-phosphate thymidylyltransferase [Elusimicrobia bacterium]|jgi:NDP-sugar pyrophosphorylase family protein|nr:glucose-1-phosphate thymidylyltransferase [Elusimicrobiota bacterium]
MFKPNNYFNIDNNIYSKLFKDCEYVWEGLNNIDPYLRNHIKPNVSGLAVNGPLIKKTHQLSNGAVVYAGAYILDDRIQLEANVKVEPGAYIAGPSIIGEGTQIRHGAYIRGKVITGKNCVIGHTTEIKNSVMLGESKAGHFSYIGDSILGEVNLGAGTKLANLKITNNEIVIKQNGKKFPTGLRKFGAILGDGVQTGCNTVTMPGTIMSKGVLTYPNTTARGYYNPETIIKLNQDTREGKIT